MWRGCRAACDQPGLMLLFSVRFAQDDGVRFRLPEIRVVDCASWHIGGADMNFVCSAIWKIRQ